MLGHWRDARLRPLLEETVLATVYATPAGLGLIDLAVFLRASVGPVRFDLDQPSGLLHVHLSDGLVASPNFQVIAHEGSQGLKEVSGQAASWCLAFDDQCGLAVFDHPENAGSPCTWRLNGEGLLHADPFAAVRRLGPLRPEAGCTLATGEMLRFRYRLCLLAPSGKPGKKPPLRLLARQQYLNYVHPPHVQVIEP
jgi:hypothetical protein